MSQNGVDPGERRMKADVAAVNVDIAHLNADVARLNADVLAANTAPAESLAGPVTNGVQEYMPRPAARYTAVDGQQRPHYHHVQKPMRPEEGFIMPPRSPSASSVAPGPPHQNAYAQLYEGHLPSYNERFGAVGAPPARVPASGYGQQTPPAPPQDDKFGGFGTWNELIAGGVVDRSYIEQEAERRKQEIDRAMDNQLAQLEHQCQQERSNIQQQAEYHTQMAEKQIESHKRQHLQHITRQAELQAYAILQRAEMEKGRLGQEACRALSQRSEHEKNAVMQDAMRKAEDVWRQSQRALLEQAQKAKQQIDSQAQNRISDIEREARQAVSRVYISPNSPLGGAPPEAFPDAISRIQAGGGSPVAPPSVPPPIPMGGSYAPPPPANYAPYGGAVTQPYTPNMEQYRVTSMPSTTYEKIRPAQVKEYDFLVKGPGGEVKEYDFLVKENK